jgi:hypothetical protein
MANSFSVGNAENIAKAVNTKTPTFAKSKTKATKKTTKASEPKKVESERLDKDPTSSQDIKSPKTEPLWVESERLDDTTPKAISAPNKAINAPTAPEHPNKGKQFRGSTGRLAGNRLSFKDMQSGKYEGAIFKGSDINKREGIKVGKRPSSLAQTDPNYRNQLLADLQKEASKHGE